jgi:hypothetical protein
MKPEIESLRPAVRVREHAVATPLQTDTSRRRLNVKMTTPRPHFLPYFPALTESLHGEPTARD